MCVRPHNYHTIGASVRLNRSYRRTARTKNRINRGPKQYITACALVTMRYIILLRPVKDFLEGFPSSPYCRRSRNMRVIYIYFYFFFVDSLPFHYLTSLVMKSVFDITRSRNTFSRLPTRSFFFLLSVSHFPRNIENSVRINQHLVLSNSEKRLLIKQKKKTPRKLCKFVLLFQLFI